MTLPLAILTFFGTPMIFFLILYSGIYLPHCRQLSRCR